MPFFSKASITLSSLAIPTLNVLILLTAVFLLLVLLYVGAVFYQARYNNNSYNLQDDDFGSVILKSLLAIVEIIVVGVILAASMFGFTSTIIFYNTKVRVNR